MKREHEDCEVYSDGILTPSAKVRKEILGYGSVLETAEMRLEGKRFHRRLNRKILI